MFRHIPDVASRLGMLHHILDVESLLGCCVTLGMLHHIQPGNKEICFVFFRIILFKKGIRIKVSIQYSTYVG